MCETNAYIFKDGKEELYLESLDSARPEDSKVYLKNMFGEQKIFNGKIKEVSFLKGRVILEEK
ncbi:MAG: CooT family nickel-binding protein [Nitrospiraceae bacterium]|nr:CooT family nickel-binding protein [Nitrospiraceae bacterium]